MNTYDGAQDTNTETVRDLPPGTSGSGWHRQPRTAWPPRRSGWRSPRRAALGQPGHGRGPPVPREVAGQPGFRAAEGNTARENRLLDPSASGSAANEGCERICGLKRPRLLLWLT